MPVQYFRSSPTPDPELRTLRLPDGGDVAVRWVRDPRARRLRLTVARSGPRLTLPRAASERLAHAFLAEHAGWLAMQLAKQPPELAPFGRDDAGPLPLRGAALPVVHREGRFARASLTAHGIELQLPARATDAQARAALREFYREQARADLGRWLPRYLPGLPVPPRVIGLRALSSIWGSLSPSRAVSLDLSLVCGRPSAFEYVLVHELCHLLHANHSRRFWREVEARWPGWRDEREYLRGEGMALKREFGRFVEPRRTGTAAGI